MSRVPGTLGKSFEPQTFETDLYSFWEKNGCFEASDENAPGQQAFSILIPPPNVTGVLHMGHALTNTIQDILVRWRRMRGDNCLWMPGTDHAGIATQAVVEKQVAKEGKGPGGKPLTRHDLGREKFVERTWKWKEENGAIITMQLRRLGSSLDWKRERFTMDEGLSKAVREVFVRLHEEGLIYRGSRIINWCPRCRTALSDLEVVPTERKGSLWHIRYKISDGSPGDPASGEIVVATTRPETLFGDTAVAVHPEDDRYTKFHGKRVVLPLLGHTVPVITDEYVDRTMGTGGLKVTPAHDFNDYELGKKHGLPFTQVIGKDGRLTVEAGKYAGLKYTAPPGQVSEARAKVLEDLAALGLLAKVEDHVNKVGLCQRCDSVAEPIISDQWFVKIEPLAKPAIEAVQGGRITFTPESWSRTYFEWMHNIRDWCISRQLWWGHQIPAWYCADGGHVTVARQAPARCGACGSTQLKQDEDVLDTWFSSSLWPFSTLGWSGGGPDETKALQTFYPTSVLETGFDILFFWVARMIMMGLHFMKEVPFRKVYLHAMVRDEKGEKMSKSKGNVIDPLGLIDQHGADPLRFTLAIMAGQGRDVKLSVDRVEGYRAFCNKLWNAVKFLHLQLSPTSLDGSPQEPIEEPAGGTGKWLKDHHADLTAANRWILSRLQFLVPQVEKGLEDFELNVSAQALYDFTWREVCDWFIEFSKLPLREGGMIRRQTVYTLHHVLETLLRLLHPFTPFVTEELWQSLPWKKAANTPTRRRDGKPEVLTLMFQPFPAPMPSMVDPEAEASMEALQRIIEAFRNFRGENNLSPKVELAATYKAGSPAAEAFVRLHQREIQAMARVGGLQPVGGHRGSKLEAVLPIPHPPVEFRVNLEGLVDVEEEVKRLRKEIDGIMADIGHVNRKLGQETFVAKAPPELVAKERRKAEELEAKRVEVQKALERFQSLVKA